MAPALTEAISSFANSGAKSKPASDHIASETSFAGPLWLRDEVGALYAKGEVHTGPFSMPLLKMGNLDKLHMPEDGKNLSILDVCCGTGITTHELQALFKEQGLDGKVDLTCGDLSEGQLAYLNKRIERMGWQNTKTVQMNLEKTQQADSSFDHIICAQGLFIIPDSQAALAECYRMLKPGGTFSIALWHKEMWSHLVHDALSHLPGHPNWPESSEELTSTWAQGPWENRHYVSSMLHVRGFEGIKTQTYSEMIKFKDAEDFYEVYDAFIEWVTDRYWTEEEKRVCKPLMRGEVIRYLEEKFGRGRGFEVEKVCLFAVCRKGEA